MTTPSRTTRSMLALVLSLLLLTLPVLAACGGDEESDASTPAAASTASGATDSSTPAHTSNAETSDPRLMTVEEANARLPFALVVPEPLPVGITLSGVLVAESNDRAIVTLQAADVAVADGDIMLAQQQSPIEPPTMPDHHPVEVQVSTTPVTRVTEVQAMCQMTRGYQWSNGDLQLQLLAGLLQDTDQAVLLPLLATLLEVSLDDITAAMQEADANATPVGRPTQENQHCNLQPEEAEDLVGFRIATPEAVPSTIWLRDIYVEGPLFGRDAPEAQDAMAVVLRYGSTTHPGRFLELRQAQSEQAMLNPPEDGSGAAEPTLLTIADTDVMFYTSAQGGPSGSTAPASGTASDAQPTTPATSGLYFWQVGETRFKLDTRLLLDGSGLSAEDVEAFIASVIAAAT